MTAPARYLFDVDLSANAAREPKPVPVAEHRAALDAAEAAGYRTGYAAAEAAAQASDARRLALAIERIAATLNDMTGGLAAIETRIERNAVEIAFAAGRKLAHELITREPMAEIERMLNSCLQHLQGAPHIVVRVGEALYDIARTRLEELARNTGFQGRLIVIAEPQIAPGDCRIEWADGGMVRDRAAIEANIAQAVSAYINGLSEQTGTDGGAR